MPSDAKAYDDDGIPVRDAAGNHLEAIPRPFVVDETYCPYCAALDSHRKAQGPNKRPGMRTVFRPAPLHP